MLIGEMLMKKTLVAFAAAATIATAIAGMPTPADARCWGCGVAAGAVGGFVAGAIVGNAIANAAPAPAYAAPPPAYVAAPPPGYVVYSAYGAPLPGPRCYWTRQPVYDMYGNVVGWRGRPIAVCS
jgi:hypothetical protein